MAAIWTVVVWASGSFSERTTYLARVVLAASPRPAAVVGLYQFVRSLGLHMENQRFISPKALCNAQLLRARPMAAA